MSMVPPILLFAYFWNMDIPLYPTSKNNKDQDQLRSEGNMRNMHFRIKSLEAALEAKTANAAIDPLAPPGTIQPSLPPLSQFNSNLPWESRETRKARPRWLMERNKEPYIPLRLEKPEKSPEAIAMRFSHLYFMSFSFISCPFFSIGCATRFTLFTTFPCARHIFTASHLGKCGVEQREHVPKMGRLLGWHSWHNSRAQVAAHNRRYGCSYLGELLV